MSKKRTEIRRGIIALLMNKTKAKDAVKGTPNYDVRPERYGIFVVIGDETQEKRLCDQPRIWQCRAPVEIHGVVGRKHRDDETFEDVIDAFGEEIVISLLSAKPEKYGCFDADYSGERTYLEPNGEKNVGEVVISFEVIYQRMFDFATEANEWKRTEVICDRIQ